MMTYKDKTFCGFYLICKNAHGCDRCLTPEVRAAAARSGMLISQYNKFPECFKAFFG